MYICIPIVVMAVITKKIEFPKSHCVSAVVPFIVKVPLLNASLTSVRKVCSSPELKQAELSAAKIYEVNKAWLK